MSDLIEKVLLLQELLIARATDTYEKGSSEAFMQLRQELLKRWIRKFKQHL